jgi:hypothetical protein
VSDIILPDGEVIRDTDVDTMADAYRCLGAQIGRCQAARFRIALALASLSPGDQKTRRVRGERLRVKVEMPDDSWSAGDLHNLWDNYPEYAPLYLTFSGFRVIAREVKKLANEQGPPRFNEFREALLAANRGPTGAPRITVEEE